MFYTIMGDDTVRFKNLSEVRASARAILGKRKEKRDRVFINKNIKVKRMNSTFYYGSVCAEISKVTDPDGLVVYLYREVVGDDRGNYRKGPLYILNVDGTRGPMVSYNKWTESRGL